MKRTRRARSALAQRAVRRRSRLSAPCRRSTPPLRRHATRVLLPRRASRGRTTKRSRRACATRRSTPSFRSSTRIPKREPARPGSIFRAARDRYEGRVSDSCKERPEDCSASEQRRRDDGGGAEALARLAVESADPQVYAWAYRACAAAPRGSAGSCQLINALQWARLDPGNAEPWFAVAREARGRRDGAGVDDAMFHVAAASLDDAGWGRLVDEMVKARRRTIDCSSAPGSPRPTR
jgi:hypothetical protein